MRARRLLAGVLAVAALNPWPLEAQTNASKAPPQPDRYLLIVETSKSMQRRANAVLGVVQDVVMSGLSGQFRDGATLGVWTFNEDLSAGRFPLQVWTSSTQREIAERTVTFLKEQKYEKQANYDKVAPALGRVISDSRRLTVILISSGDWKMRGTPFDDQINGSFQKWRDQQQKARMPIVTILSTRKGQVGAYSVNTPPWPLQVPQLAPEPKSVQTTNRQPLTARHNVTTSTVAPLIISGRKPQPEPVPAPKPEPAVVLTPAPSPVAGMAVTNQPSIVMPPDPLAPPVVVAKAQPTPAAVEKPMAEQPPKVVTVPTPASEPKPESLKALGPKAAEPLPGKPEAAPPPAAPMPKPEPVAVEQPKPSAAPEVKPEPAPAAPVIAEPPRAVAPSAAAPQAIPTKPSSPVPDSSSHTAPPSQAATAAPAESLLRARNILIAGVTLAVVGLGLVLLLIRRSRTAPQASLITRSFEREKGP